MRQERRLGRRLERGRHGRRPRALVGGRGGSGAGGAREERPLRPASFRRPGFLPRPRAGRLAPRASAAAAEAPLRPALGGESTSTEASPQRAAADGSPRARSSQPDTAPGRPRPCPRPPPPGRRAPPPPPPLRLRPAPTPGRACQARSECSELALPLATHTHFLLSLNWSTDPGGRRRRRWRRGRMGAGGGRREEGAEGGAARPLLEGSPGLAAAARAALGLGRPLGLCGRLLLPRPLRGRRAQRSRSPPERSGAGPGVRGAAGAATNLPLPAAPGSGKAGIWRPLPVAQPPRPGSAASAPGRRGAPRGSAARAQAPPSRLRAGGRGARAPRLPDGAQVLAEPQPLVSSFPVLFPKRHSLRKYLASPLTPVQ